MANRLTFNYHKNDPRGNVGSGACELVADGCALEQTVRRSISFGDGGPRR
jgi:hypothetical protein